MKEREAATKRAIKSGFFPAWFSLTQSLTPRDRYTLHLHADGTWYILDRMTGEVATWRTVPQSGLEIETADNLVDLLNMMERNGESKDERG